MKDGDGSIDIGLCFQLHLCSAQWWYEQAAAGFCQIFTEVHDWSGHSHLVRVSKKIGSDLVRAPPLPLPRCALTVLDTPRRWKAILEMLHTIRR